MCAKTRIGQSDLTGKSYHQLSSPNITGNKLHCAIVSQIDDFEAPDQKTILESLLLENGIEYKDVALESPGIIFSGSTKIFIPNGEGNLYTPKSINDAPAIVAKPPENTCVYIETPYVNSVKS